MVLQWNNRELGFTFLLCSFLFFCHQRDSGMSLTDLSKEIPLHLKEAKEYNRLYNNIHYKVTKMEYRQEPASNTGRQLSF